MPDWLASILQSVLDVSNVLNTSMAASWLILVVIVLRVLLKKAPKWLHVSLWGLVAVRLLMPFSVESGFSLLPLAEIVTGELLQAGPVEGAQSAYLEIVSNPNYGRGITVELDRSIGAFQWDLLGITFVWLLGIVVLAVYAIISSWRLYRNVNMAVRYRENIFQSEQVETPFVLGIFRPKIFLPFFIDGQVLEYVVAHEQAHIYRKDHWWKPLGFLLLTIHWFNPLMWLAYILLCRDIELACDEKVIKDLNRDQKADYTQALVACSVSRRVIAACPLAFGEVGIKARVKSVMQYRKPTFWMVVLAIFACIAAAVCFLTNPIDPGLDQSFLNYQNAVSVAADLDEMVAIYCPSSDSGASIQIGAASGADLAKQLSRWKWKACKPPRDSLPSPGSVEFVLEEWYRITVHQKKTGSLRQYAVIKYGDEVQYYTIHRSDYPDAVALVYAPALQNPNVSKAGYSLTIGAEGIMRIEITAPDHSGGCENADGSLFQKGDRVWLEPLDGCLDLQGVTITAKDSNGYDVFAVRISDYYDPENPDAPIVCGDWILSPEYH